MVIYISIQTKYMIIIIFYNKMSYFGHLLSLLHFTNGSNMFIYNLILQKVLKCHLHVFK